MTNFSKKKNAIFLSICHFSRQIILTTYSHWKMRLRFCDVTVFVVGLSKTLSKGNFDLVVQILNIISGSSGNPFFWRNDFTDPNFVNFILSFYFFNEWQEIWELFHGRFVNFGWFDHQRCSFPASKRHRFCILLQLLTENSTIFPSLLHLYNSNQFS